MGGSSGYSRPVGVSTGGGGGASGAGAYSAAAAAALSQRDFHADCKPIQKGARAKLVSDAQTPVVIALDVSGSMADWPKIFYDKLPML
jgi:hypothetical protein